MSLLTFAAAMGTLVVSPAGASTSPVVSAAPLEMLESLDLASGQVQTLVLPDSVGDSLAVEVVLDGDVELLRLVPHSMRSADFEVLTPGPDGTLLPTAVAAPTTVRGTVAGRSDAWVAGSLSDGRLEVLVSLGDGRSFGVQPAPEGLVLQGARPHVIYEASDIVPPPGTCATPDFLEPDDRLAGSAPQPQLLGVADIKVCEVACDADFEFYQSNMSSVDKTVADIEKILIGCEAIYGFEVEVLYEIGTIIVRTSEPDPYTQTNPSSLLQQFDSHWSSQQSGVQRDIAHLFTGKNLDGSTIGIARLNAICSQTNGYGLSQSKYTNSLVLRTRLTAHELGHNWAASHCNGAGDCGIMCQGGCGSPTEFGTTSTNSILNEKASSGCLSALTASPVLTSITEDASTWLPEPIVIEGTDLFTAGTVTIDGIGTNSFTVIDDLTIELVPTLPTALGDVDVSVTTPLGTSNELALTFTDTDPPQMDAPTSPGFGQIVTWRYAGKANAGAVLVFGFANTTIPISGIDLLLPDTIVSVGSLDQLGLGELTFTFPVIAVFTPVFSQLVTVDGSGVKASEVAQSIVWI